MPLAKNGPYANVTASLRKEQVHKLRALKTNWHTEESPVSLADVMRVVVERGLEEILRDQRSSISRSSGMEAA